jgi:hypothetical protein
LLGVCGIEAIGGKMVAIIASAVSNIPARREI